MEAKSAMLVYYNIPRADGDVSVKRVAKPMYTQIEVQRHVDGLSMIQVTLAASKG